RSMMEYKQVEKQVTRDSKLKHLTHKVCKRDLCFTNLKVNTSAEELLKASKSLFAYPSPVAGGSTLSISKLSSYGKAPDMPFSLKGHTDAITCFEFSPFNDRVIATGSRDCTARLWHIDDELDMQPNTWVEPLLTLPKQAKRFTGLYFHPSVDSLLVSATTDYAVDLWDLTQEGRVIQRVTGASDTVMSLSWNTWSGGNQFVTSSKDKKLRIYDPRDASGVPVHEIMAHEGAQGFKTVWVDGNGLDLICTVGVNKSAQRQMYLWDTRNLVGRPPITHNITSDSSSLNPYYDYANNLIYLGGKGDGIYSVEVDRSGAHAIGKATFGANNTATAISMLPKTCCDVNLCEISRFLRLSNNNQVEMVSFVVPRGTTVFQEDLYPPAPSGDPTSDVHLWLQDRSANFKPLTISMRPEGQLSIYEVAEEQGGKSKEKDKLDQIAAKLDITDDLMDSPISAYVNDLLVQQQVQNLNMDDQTSCHTDTPSQPPPMNISGDVDQRPVLKRTHSILSRNPSYTSLRMSGSMTPPSSSGTPPSFSRTSSTSSLLASSSSSKRQQVIIFEGGLYELVDGTPVSHIEKWYTVTDSSMLCSFKSAEQAKGDEPLETIHLDRAISVIRTKDIFKVDDGHGYSFQLTTPTRIMHLLAKTKNEMKSWMSMLRQHLLGSGEIKPPGSDGGADSFDNDGADEHEEDDSDDEVDDQERCLDGHMFRKLNGMFSTWDGCYVHLLEEDLFISKNKHAATPELRIQLQSITQINKVSANEFELCTGPSNEVVCSLKTVEMADDQYDPCAHWIESLEIGRKRSMDVIKMLGITDLKSMAEEDERYLDLNDVKNGNCKILMQVKGRRKIRVVTTKLEASSLNTNNSFVLDAGPKIYIWAGAKSSRVNKAKALDFANRIREKERGGRATIIQLDEGKEDSCPEFRDLIVGMGESTPATTPTPDEQDMAANKMVIYRIGMDIKRNCLKARLAWEGTDWRLPKKELLFTKFVYVIVCCGSEMFIWIGKESASSQRRMAHRVALALIDADKDTNTDMPSWIKITKINESGETNLFKEKFSNYPGMLPISTSKMDVMPNMVAATKTDHSIEHLVALMQRTPPNDAEKIVTSPDVGKVKIWKIDDFEKVDHPPHLYGQFFSGDSYIVLYSYMISNREMHIIYYYQGRDSTTNEKGTSAYLTVDLHDQLGVNCVQVRVVQNKECTNFLNLFKRRMVIHRGKYQPPANDDGASPTATSPVQAKSLYEVRGGVSSQPVDIDTRAVQVDLKASMLNSQHTFILSISEDNHVTVWRGRYSSEPEYQCALAIAKTTLRTDLGTTFSFISEGDEPDGFWKHLDGARNKEQAINDHQQSEGEVAVSVALPPRLFICSNSTGIIEITQEVRYSQDDLDTSKVIILDVHTHLYVWIGTRTSHKTKKLTMETAIEYWRRKQGEGDGDLHSRVLVIEPYQEPLEFKSYFRAWTSNKYPKIRLGMPEKCGVVVMDKLREYQKEVYQYEELLADPLPAGVDATKLELYLPDEEFERVIGMSRKEWDKVPSWKRENIKKSVYLY
ncbi:hypothetical protein SAMD00019534_040640, partial [Acytostelium subglobosum LB1]|uniref:hypothetical protein n=1 Tax=Acytostelium subglobosum LB1 TaxID=1410327 RepID=UPI0006450212